MSETSKMTDRSQAKHREKRSVLAGLRGRRVDVAIRPRRPKSEADLEYRAVLEAVHRRAS